MAFDVAATSYDLFMGRYSTPLAGLLVERAGPREGARALDVGCGPGALIGALVERLGPDRVAAVDPSAPFVEAARARHPGVDVRSAAAEDLPFDDSSFDAALASLVVHFMRDPVAGLGEMSRVTRPGGALGATVWDHGGGHGPLSLFWRAVNELTPGARDESGLAGARAGHLASLARDAGWVDVRESTLDVEVGYETFEEWWQPYTLAVGPAGDHVSGLAPDERDALRDHCASLLPPAPFTVSASAWCVIARSQ